jgi:hypothetical protein
MTDNSTANASGAVVREEAWLSVEVAVERRARTGAPSLFTADARTRPEAMHDLHAEPGQLDRTAAELARLGFRVLQTSRLSISVECPASLFTEIFGTELAEQDVVREPAPAPARPLATSYLAPTPDATWAPPPVLEGLVERAYIQPPYLYFESPVPPRVDYHHLRVPGDVATLLRAPQVHREGITGRGVTVAMIDSGFHLDHPYFVGNGYTMSRMLAPGASLLDRDENGHGTAESANIFAVAPDVTFLGVKAGPSLAAAFKATAQQRPDVISVSLGFDLRGLDGLPQPALPNFLKVLEAEITDAVADGIVVVFSAGNGHIAFPGMHPDVISAGGAYIDEDLSLQASDYASAFSSIVYPGRAVPDVAGLVGMQPDADYIMLPLPAGCEIDQDGSAHDGTARDDGWAVISGTSAAAPQIAGVIALLKQQDPALSPADVKAVLRATARDVTDGNANPGSNPVRRPNGQVTGQPIAAGIGPDGATGHGLVDAFAAWKQVV